MYITIKFMKKKIHNKDNELLKKVKNLIINVCTAVKKVQQSSCIWSSVYNSVQCIAVLYNEVLLCSAVFYITAWNSTVGGIFSNDQEHSLSRLYLPKIYKILQRRLCYSSYLLLHAWGRTVVFWQCIFSLYICRTPGNFCPSY